MDFSSCNNHYFYDVDMKEDFYRCIAPSEDIWKKFELVPGFPLSSGGCPGGGGTDWAAEMMDLGWESPVKLTGLSSVVLLRDCMWSGFSTRERLEKVIHERLSTGSPRVTNTQKPVADNETSEPGVDSIEQNATPLVVPTPIPEKVPNSSGSESTSDSEEDEIDVVTVEKRKSYGGRQPVTITVRADPTATKLFHISIHQQQHNYAARLPPDPNTMSPQHNFHSTVKEEPGEVTSPPELQPCSPQMPDSPLASGSSDSEDLAKRKNHNYLERKRRNDLRSRFLALREEVPSLSRSTKTPKVVVLSKATEFLKGLVIQEQQLTAEKLKLWSRHQQLLRRISQLKGR
ncbi:protein L-Myc-1-B isoform X2 [Xenopus laevis]|nr:protein L-Myc-1-B [Xenopus laevis]XP_018097236.1 protein L-Myc-1-B isoform X2 [Xenopus laevis]AAH43622.1 Lmyc-b protein [Xenopus laevis]AAI10941.1 Lmyc-b protein [Xenopus laevis]